LKKQASSLKITVLKRFEPGEVFDQPIVKGAPTWACRLVQEGQVFIVEDDGKMPEGFCKDAWDDIFKFIMTLRFGGNFSTWHDEPGVSVACCTDGLRPVVFKIERI
jgi:uncharacterized repeat protein (TIGR04076 family)